MTMLYRILFRLAQIAVFPIGFWMATFHHNMGFGGFLMIAVPMAVILNVLSFLKERAEKKRESI